MAIDPDPVITTLKNGKVCIAWQNPPAKTQLFGSSSDIFLKCSSDEGSSFSKPVNVSNNTSFQDFSRGILLSSIASEHPQITSDGNRIFVVWENMAGDEDDEIMFSRFIAK